MWRYVRNASAGGTHSGGGGRSLGESPLSPRLEENLSEVKATLGRSQDVIIREFTVGGHGGIRAASVAIDGLVDRTIIHRDLLESLMYRIRSAPVQTGPQSLHQAIKAEILQFEEVSEVDRLNKLLDEVLDGNAILLLDGDPVALSLNTKGWDKRAVEQPVTEHNVRGPRDAFTEELLTNTARLRRRIKDPDLIVWKTTVGRRTKTLVAVLHIQGVAEEQLVGTIKERLQQARAKIDGIIEGAQIEELLLDPSMTPFPRVIATERPDRAASALLQGQLVVVVDTTPFVLILPAVLPAFFQAGDDYTHLPPVALFLRFLRLIGWLAGLTLPALYVSLNSVNPDVIPPPLAMVLAASREGIPYPALVEVLFMDLAIELVAEASTRLPTFIGPSVTIVGGLIIGTAAAQAKIISNIMIVVVSVMAIGTFSLPNYQASLAFRLVKYPFTFLAAVFGLFGISVAFLLMVVYLTSMDSFGRPYLSPFGPMRPGDLKDTFPRASYRHMIRRPRAYLRNPGRRAELEEQPEAGDHRGDAGKTK